MCLAEFCINITTAKTDGNGYVRYPDDISCHMYIINNFISYVLFWWQITILKDNSVIFFPLLPIFHLTFPRLHQLINTSRTNPVSLSIFYYMYKYPLFFYHCEALFILQLSLRRYSFHHLPHSYFKSLYFIRSFFVFHVSAPKNDTPCKPSSPLLRTCQTAVGLIQNFLSRIWRKT